MTVHKSPLTKVNGTLKIKSACQSFVTLGKMVLYALIIISIGMKFVYTGYTRYIFEKKLTTAMQSAPTKAPINAPVRVFLCL